MKTGCIEGAKSQQYITLEVLCEKYVQNLQKIPALESLFNL